MKSKEENQNTVVALVEVGGSHDECLLSQMHALKSAGIKVVMICTPEIRERNPIFEEYIDQFFITHFHGSGMKDFRTMRAALKFMKREKVSKAVLNTAQGSHIRNLCWMARRVSIEFIGIIHTTRKFEGSFTQKSINRKVKKYFLLSQFLKNKVDAPKGIQLEYFYPIRFNKQEWNLPKPERLEVTIIGGVENRRKDLEGFVAMVQGLKEQVHFTFLGKSDPQKEEVVAFRKALDEANLLERVTMYSSFVSQDDFDIHLQHTDVILPLIHPDTPSADQYFKNQIAGAMSVSFGYKIPLFMHEGYQHIEEMEEACIYYTQENFAERFPSVDDLAQRSKQMETKEEFDQNFQENRYRLFLFQ